MCAFEFETNENESSDVRSLKPGLKIWLRLSVQGSAKFSPQNFGVSTSGGQSAMTMQPFKVLDFSAVQEKCRMTRNEHWMFPIMYPPTRNFHGPVSGYVLSVYVRRRCEMHSSTSWMEPMHMPFRWS